MAKTYEEASDVSAEGGAVHVDGPDGIAISLSPSAALATGERLIEAAAEAQGQRHLADLDEAARTGRAPERY